MRIADLCKTCFHRNKDSMEYPCNLCNPIENKYREATVEEIVFIELEAKLKTHDWYYMMSDDHRVYTRGYEASQALARLLEDARKIDKVRADALYEEYRK